MKIGIACDGANVSQHFGHCEGFMTYDVDGGKASEGTMVPNPGHQPGFLPVFLKEQGVDVIIAGGMGGHAQQLFTQNGIKVITGAQGTCGDALASYVGGSLVSTNETCTAHGDDCN